MKSLNNVIQYLTFILVLLFSTSTVYGQVNKKVGTRITDLTTEKELKTNAILDLESTSKGFFLPRMTTLQRDAIKKEMGKDNGLAVYNIDNDCLEYWSERASKWMSVCGSLPPAKLDLDENSCEQILFIGFETMVGNKPQLQQGKALDSDKHWMSVSLKVKQIGTYTISANSNNGYFFSGEGQFQAIGTYKIILKGMGTPVNGYDPNGVIKGDKLHFTVNGIDSNICTNTELLVIPADLDFVITSVEARAEGKYNVNVPASLKQGNSIELRINTKVGGLATITATNRVLGMKFSGSKNIEQSDTKFILEPILGENIPLENDIDSYDFVFDVNTKNPKETINGSKAVLSVEKTQIKAEFAEVNLGKEPYYQGTALNQKHTIELPIKVINSGKTTLYLKKDGLEFKAENVLLEMPADADATQLVKFTAVTGGVLPVQESVDLVLSGDDGKRFEIIAGDVLSLPIEKKPVAYTINCSSVKTNRSAIPYNKPVGTSFYIITEVNVTVAGEYEISTSSPVDGISFSTSVKGVKKVFTKTGKQTVELYAVDGTVIPTKRGVYTTNLVANDMSKESCNNIKLKVGYGDVNVLIIRHLVIEAEEEEGETLFLTGKNSNGKFRFGENGVYAETGNVKITTWNMTAEKWASDTAKYIDEIKANKYNFILITNQYTPMSINDELATTLINYVKKNGVLVYSSLAHYGSGAIKDYMKMLDFKNEEFMAVTGKKYNGGKDLFKFLVGQSTLPMDSFSSDNGFTGNVVDLNHPLSKSKFGVKYILVDKPSDLYQPIYWYSLERGYRNAMDISKTNLVSLVADRGSMYKEARGILFTHKTYSNVVIAPVLSNWFRSPMATDFHIDKKGEPYINGIDYNGKSDIETQAGLFMANVYIELMQRIANQ